MGNGVLYDLVAQHPGNKNLDEIVAKFWIIGRSYAATVERRGNKAATPGDFYYGYVAPAIADSDLDERINEMKQKQYTEINREALEHVLSLHGYLVGLLKDLTEKEKRSLASKYLHFHLPHLVFIYDSRVSQVIGKFARVRVRSSDIQDGWDSTYAKFAFRVYAIYQKLRERPFASRHGDTLPRVIDNFLLRYCDSLNLEGTIEH